MHRSKYIKRNSSTLILILLIIAFFFVSVTIAFLVSVSNGVENSFAEGTIKVTLSESSGNSYQLIPGTIIFKDPKILVKGGSEECWLFVKIEKNNNPDAYLSYALETGWTALSGGNNLYYRKISAIDEDTFFQVLKNNEVTVKDTVTEEMLNEISDKPTLEFTAFAIQSQGVGSPEYAWTLINEED